MTNVSQGLDLPVGSIGRHAKGWWGMIMLIVTEGALFVYLLFAYYTRRFSTAQTGCRRTFGPSGCRAVFFVPLADAPVGFVQAASLPRLTSARMRAPALSSAFCAQRSCVARLASMLERP